MFNPRARHVPALAPFDWLIGGGRDLYAAAGPCLVYGGLFALIGAGLSGAAFASGRGAWTPAIASGFLILAPVLAAGFYGAGHALEQGSKVRLSTVFRPRVESPASLALLTILLCGLFVLWLSFADAISLFIGSRVRSGLDIFLAYLSEAPEGGNFALVGVAFGGFLAAAAFAIAALSTPLLMDHETGVLTAIRFSLSAIINNPVAMGIWAVLIASLTAIGIATFFLWFIPVFPWLGLATWRAYRALASSPQLDAGAAVSETPRDQRASKN